MESLRFSGRAYLRKGQHASFSTSYGSSYFQIAQNVGANPSANAIRGFLIDKACDVTSLSLSYRTSSTSPSVRWITHLLRCSASGQVTKYPTAEQRPATRNRRVVQLDVEDIFCEPGDLLSVLFERTSTEGLSTYYVYLDAVISLRSP